MRFLLLGDWPINGGALVVPVGTFLEYIEGAPSATIVAQPWGVGAQFNGMAVPIPLPINARCEDQAAYDQMVTWYTPISDQLLRTIHYGPNVQPKKGN